jgi:ABC-type multidrug transport system ATPase subunit
MILRIENLTKIYQNGKIALNNINLEIKDGVFGLIGPNGAGKTTLMSIITLLLEPTSGKVHFDDIDLFSHHTNTRKIIGYLPQEYDFYPNLKAYEFLDYVTSLYGIPKLKRSSLVDDLLHKVNLFDVRKRLIRTFSGGMKQRLGIAQALINDSKILILDEPTSGLDPEERVRFRNALFEIAQNRILILSTHIIKDVEFACTDMAVIDEGEIRYKGSPTDFINYAVGKTFELEIQPEELDRISKTYCMVSCIEKNSNILVRIVCEEKPDVIAYEVEPTLEDSYIYFQNFSVRKIFNE